MKLVITDTNGEQVVIDTNGKTDGQQAANSARPDNGGGKQTGQKPQDPAQADNGAKQAEQKPQQSPQVAVNDKKNEQRPEEVTEPGNGVKQTEQKPQQSAQASTQGKKNEEQPGEPAKAENGSTQQTKQTEQKHQQPTPADAHGQKNEQKSPDSKAEPPKSVSHSRRTIVLAAVVVVALAVSGYIVWRVFFAKPKLPDSIVTLSGRIEGDDSAIAAKTTGRVLEIRFREGDAVNAGDVIATLSDEQVRARQEQAQAGVSIMAARSKSARDQIGVWISSWSRISFKPRSRK